MASQNAGISAEGLRVDGRRAGEIRRLRCRVGVLAAADGSAYLEQGNTFVLVSVSGPHDARSSRSKGQQPRGTLLTCEFRAMPYATGEHKPQSESDRSATEMAAAVRRVFEPVVQAYSGSQVDVSITLLQADGGIRSAAINATTLALIDAGVAMEDFVCACSAGSVHGALLLDPNSQEDGAGAELSVAYLPRSERVSFVQLESKVPLGSMEEILNFALEGGRQVFSALSAAVRLRLQERCAAGQQQHQGAQQTHSQTAAMDE